MSFIPSTPQLPTYFDSNGNILASGRLYYYEQGANPNTPKTVYSDYTRTTTLDQPVSVGNDGRTAQQVFLGTGPYTVEQWKYNGSTHVKDTEWDEDGLSSSATQTTSTNVDTISALRVLDDPATVGSVDVLGYYASGDMFARGYVWNASDLNVDNGGTIIKKTGVSTGSWICNLGSIVDCRVFGLLPNTSAQANSIITTIVGWMVGNTAVSRTLALVSGVYSCVGDYIQSVGVDLDIEDGVYFNNTTAGTTYTLKPTKGYSIKLSAKLQSSGSNGAVVLDVSESIIDSSANALWYGANSSNSDSQNSSALSGGACISNKIIISEGLSIGSWYPETNISIIGGGYITPTATIELQEFDTVKGGLRGSLFAFGTGKDVNLSYFDDGSAIATVLANAHGSCSAYGNKLIWDQRDITLGSYTQATQSPNEFSSASNLITNSGVTLYDVSCSKSSTFFITSGTLTLLKTDRIKVSWFDSIQDALNCAVASNAILDGENRSISGSSALTFNGSVKCYDLVYTNSSGTGATIGANSIDVVLNGGKLGGAVSSFANGYTSSFTANNVEFTNGVSTTFGTNIFNGCSIRSTSLLNSVQLYNCSFSGGIFNSTGNIIINGGSISATKLSIFDSASLIQNVFISNFLVTCSRVATVETGYIEFLAYGANTAVNNVSLDGIKFIGSADAEFKTIKNNVSGVGTFAANYAVHKYISKNHTVQDSDMVAPMTDLSFLSQVTSQASTGQSLAIDLTSSKFLLFGSTSESRSAWQMTAIWPTLGTSNMPKVSSSLDLAYTTTKYSTAVYDSALTAGFTINVDVIIKRGL